MGIEKKKEEEPVSNEKEELQNAGSKLNLPRFFI